MYKREWKYIDELHRVAVIKHCDTTLPGETQKTACNYDKLRYHARLVYSLRSGTQQREHNSRTVPELLGRFANDLLELLPACRDASGDAFWAGVR